MSYLSYILTLYPLRFTVTQHICKCLQVTLCIFVLYDFTESSSAVFIHQLAR